MQCVCVVARQLKNGCITSQKNTPAAKQWQLANTTDVCLHTYCLHCSHHSSPPSSVLSLILSPTLLPRSTSYALSLISSVRHPPCPPLVACLPGPDMDNAVDRESHSLAAGLCLGMILLAVVIHTHAHTHIHMCTRIHTQITHTHTHTHTTPAKVHAEVALPGVQKGNRSPGISDLDLVEKLVVYISGGANPCVSSRACDVHVMSMCM